MDTAVLSTEPSLCLVSMHNHIQLISMNSDGQLGLHQQIPRYVQFRCQKCKSQVYTLQIFPRHIKRSPPHGIKLSLGKVATPGWACSWVKNVPGHSITMIPPSPEALQGRVLSDSKVFVGNKILSMSILKICSDNFRKTCYSEFELSSF